jgi:hypothetical protein
MDIRTKYELLSKHLNERTIRLVVAAEAKMLGRGGITRIHEGTGMSRKSIAFGIAELDGKACSFEGRNERIRRKGGGRKRTADTDPDLKKDLRNLLNGTTRGDPESPLLWTTKSVRRLSSELNAIGHKTSRRMVNELLREIGYSLQSNRKKGEGGDHPDRDAQFKNIADRVAVFLKEGEPVISVDTKKKELVGNYKNNGREWHEGKSPTEVNAYDFPDENGRVSPYGVYDIADNSGWVSVGITNDTAEFAVESIRKWWMNMGKEKYPKARKLLITADGGGSNGRRVRLWKTELQKFSNEARMKVLVSHFPPGTSKWNKIEHRMFSYISMNWREKPLLSYEVIVNLIAGTTTAKGLHIQCAIDPASYEKDIKITDEEIAALYLVRDDFHGEWNYSILPQH